MEKLFTAPRTKGAEDKALMKKTNRLFTAPVPARLSIGLAYLLAGSVNNYSRSCVGITRTGQEEFRNTPSLTLPNIIW